MAASPLKRTGGFSYTNISDTIPLGWSTSISPNAEMTSSSLFDVSVRLAGGDSPVVHNDRGCYHRWPDRTAICAERGLVRLMLWKGCSPSTREPQTSSTG